MGKKERFGTCTKDCYGACVFKGVWNDNNPEKKFIKGIPIINHPFTQGIFCNKLANRENYIYHPKRIKSFLVRASPKGENKFKKTGHNKAIDLISNKIKEIYNIFGPKSIMGTYYSGNSSLISCNSPLKLFNELNAITTVGGICNEGGCAGLQKIFGTYSISNPLQLDHVNSKLIVIWGSNITENNNHAYLLIKKAKNNGTKIVTIDSRLTSIARKSDISIIIKPNTDHFLAWYIIKHLINEKQIDQEFLEKNCIGYKEIIAQLKNYNLRKLLSYCGAENQLEKINYFIEYLKNNKEHTIFNIGFGVQKDRFGGRIVQSIALIQIFLGNVLKSNPGMGIIYSQSAYIRDIVDKMNKIIIDKNDTSNQDGNSKSYDVISLASHLEENNIKILFIWNFNPASSLPNQNHLRRILKKEDLFVIVLDMFLNETTRYADVVVPAKFDVETNDILSSYYIPQLSINEAGPCPYSNCMSNIEFFNELGKHLIQANLIDEPLSQSFTLSDKEILDKCMSILPKNIQSSIENNGYYVFVEKDTVLLKKDELKTKSGKMELDEVKITPFNEKIISNLNENEFQLITPSQKDYLHSQLGDYRSFLSKYNKIDAVNIESKGEEFDQKFNTLYLSAIDLHELNLNKGDFVIMKNKHAKCSIKIGLNNELQHKVALLYSGGPDRASDKINANFFTPDIAEEMGGSGSYNSSIITIEKINNRKKSSKE